MFRAASRFACAATRVAHRTHRSLTTSTVDPSEVARFTTLAAHWWRDAEGGACAGLHALNRVRVPLIRAAASGDFLSRRSPEALARGPLGGLSILDVGCGGGILSEALARLGADVTGIDATPASVGAAAAHARLDERLHTRLTYESGTAEGLVARGARFDCVVCSEVLEHIESESFGPFLDALVSLLNPRGHLIITTIARTPASYALAVLGAEYVLRVVPPGTHEWTKFVPPHDLAAALVQRGLVVERLVGLAYAPWSGTWSEAANTDVNYGLVATWSEAAGGAVT